MTILKDTMNILLILGYGTLFLPLGLRPSTQLGQETEGKTWSITHSSNLELA